MFYYICATRCGMRLGEGTMAKEELIAYIIELLKDASEHELKAIKCFISAYLGKG